MRGFRRVFSATSASFKKKAPSGFRNFSSGVAFVAAPFGFKRFIVSCFGAAAATTYYMSDEAHALCEPTASTCLPNPYKLPTIPLSEVEKHTSHGDIWVTYRGGVYDVSEFIDCHPGGASRIMMMAGRDLKHTWEIYDLHPTRPHIIKILETYRIGNLTQEDRQIVEERSKMGNAYLEDPSHEYQRKHHRMASTIPWNSEPKAALLGKNFITANEDFFIRSHHPIPNLNADECEIEVEGNETNGVKSKTFTIDELKKIFPKHEVTATLSCAGVRQEEFMYPPTEEQAEALHEHAKEPLYVAPHWNSGAIGTAKWGGAKLRDVLEYCGLDVDGLDLGKRDSADCSWVSFVGHDCDETGVQYAGVLPIEKAAGAKEDVLLCYEMNGKPLPADHGHPVRVVAPGRAGCRQVKWVNSILVDSKPSNLDSGSKLDRHFCPGISFENHIRRGECKLRLDQAPVIQTLPIQSFISDYEVDEKKQEVELVGVAYAGGGRGVARVDVSVDGGKHFIAADTASPFPYRHNGNNWTWMKFHQRVPMSCAMKDKLRSGEQVKLELVSKATDFDFNSQPESINSTWNVMGICVNHWHRTKVVIPGKN